MRVTAKHKAVQDGSRDATRNKVHAVKEEREAQMKAASDTSAEKARAHIEKCQDRLRNDAELDKLVLGDLEKDLPALLKVYHDKRLQNWIQCWQQFAPLKGMVVLEEDDGNGTCVKKSQKITLGSNKGKAFRVKVLAAIISTCSACTSPWCIPRPEAAAPCACHNTSCAC